MKVLFLGEIVGIPAVKQIRKKITKIIEKYHIDFVIANGDGASDGYGILAETASELLDCGINVVTGGDLIFNKKNIKDFIEINHTILRPANLSEKSPGRGYGVFVTDSGVRIGVISILGRTNFIKIFANDPYKACESIVEHIKQECDLIIVDFHGGTTSEIQSMQWHLAGSVTAVLGTNLRVLTADNRILYDHTAVITGTGLCSAIDSVGGFDPEIEARKMITGRFLYSKILKENIYLQGVIIEADQSTGKALSIDIINESLH